MSPLELVGTIAAGLGAGAPVALVTLRHLGTVASHLLRAVVALEAIAARLEGADYVTLPPKVSRAGAGVADA